MNRQIAREMLKDFRAQVSKDERHKKCPFRIETVFYDVSYNHDLCALLFPRWAKKYGIGGLTKRILFWNSCPCKVMAHSYVRGRVRKFLDS